ncbi:MAG: iron-sulfur cluster repair di-iron protein, ric [Clostridiales bacterium]|nr:iron-sulfur cluster repair di-iron protein, ric [Clostridiales bacterium]
MMNKERFNEVWSEHFETLKLYVPIVAKVHGKHHPEFHEVRRLYDVIEKKTEESGQEAPNLVEEFSQLQDITNNYTVPDDVCESYEAVYKMLKELDDSYQG